MEDSFYEYILAEFSQLTALEDMSGYQIFVTILSNQFSLRLLRRAEATAKGLIQARKQTWPKRPDFLVLKMYMLPKNQHRTIFSDTGTQNRGITICIIFMSKFLKFLKFYEPILEIIATHMCLWVNMCMCRHKKIHFLVSSRNAAVLCVLYIHTVFYLMW